MSKPSASNQQNRAEATERFRKTLSETTRALSGCDDLSIYYGKVEEAPKGALALPDIPRTLPPERQAHLRAFADRQAFRLRYGGSADDLAGWLAGQGALARQIVHTLETARVEVRGMRDFAGTADDLQQYWQAETTYILEGSDVLSQQVHALALALKQHSGVKLGATQADFLRQTLKQLPKEIKNWLQQAANDLDTPDGRHKNYAKLIKLLDLDKKQQESDEQAPGENKQSKPGKQQPTTGESGGEESKDEQQSREDAAHQALNNMLFGTQNQVESTPETHEDGATGGKPLRTDIERGYKVFTTVHDRTVHARSLVGVGEMAQLERRFSALTAQNRGLVRRLAARLRKHLLATHPSGWQRDQEEGLLDPAKLAPFIAGKNPYMYRVPRERQSLDTLVTLLIDNSGSMRGKPIEMAAVSMDLLSRTMEDCGVSVEVLGFTTMAWKGGKSRMDWLRGGGSANPGRLNDVLHIIYKPAGKRYRHGRANFPAMLADDVLKENIDGEALNWAYSRLLKRPEKRKILLVISDGAPVDYATDRHNPAGYLDRHLRDVITRIEGEAKAQLLAIGIGHDVGRYYRNAIAINDPATLAETLVTRLLALFNQR